MKFRIDAVSVLAVAFCLLIVVGECITYDSDFFDRNSSVSWDGDHSDYTVSSSSSDAYSVVSMDSGGRTPVSKLIMYVDTGYGIHYDEAYGLTGTCYIDQEYYAHQYTEAFHMRGFTDIVRCGTTDLNDALSGSLSNPQGVGLLVFSYMLPGDVYDGTGNCLLLEWISNGGTLYWFGSEIGRFYSEGDALVDVVNNQEMLFGKCCINTSGNGIASSAAGEFTDSLYLKGCETLYSVDTSVIDGAVPMGYMDGGFSTIVFVERGSGQICVFSGEPGYDQTDDMGQIIAGGVSVSTSLVDVHTGTVTRGTVEGNIDTVAEDSLIYVFTGGYYVNYGEVYIGS